MLKVKGEVRKLIQPLIEFCISNLAEGAQEARVILESDPNLDIIEYSCLSHCSICERGLFALVNGDVVTGENAQDLVDKIYIYLEENPMF